MHNHLAGVGVGRVDLVVGVVVIGDDQVVGRVDQVVEDVGWEDDLTR